MLRKNAIPLFEYSGSFLSCSSSDPQVSVCTTLFVCYFQSYKSSHLISKVDGDDDNKGNVAMLVPD